MISRAQTINVIPSVISSSFSPLMLSPVSWWGIPSSGRRAVGPSMSWQCCSLGSPPWKCQNYDDSDGWLICGTTIIFNDKYCTKALNLRENCDDEGLVGRWQWNGSGDISPGPFCPITRLLCGHRAGGKPIPQYPSVNMVLLCVAGG